MTIDSRGTDILESDESVPSEDGSEEGVVSNDGRSLLVHLVVEPSGSESGKWLRACVEARERLRGLFEVRTNRPLDVSGPFAADEPSMLVREARDIEEIVAWARQFPTVIHSFSFVDSSIMPMHEVTLPKKRKKQKSSVVAGFDGIDDDDDARVVVPIDADDD